MSTLDKSDSGLTAFPEGISEDCTELLVYANKIKKCPPSIGTLKQLKVLNAFNNQIGMSLPDEIGTLAALEEVNFAANKLVMLKDVHFASWSKVTVLNLNDNNLASIGSLAPLTQLEELRIFANQLTAMPALASPELKILEVHKNRITAIEDDYFEKIPALERLSIWANQIPKLPSLVKCTKLLGVQAQTNPLKDIPDSLPDTLETLFLQETQVDKLPKTLPAALKRVNITGLSIDDQLAKQVEELTLGKAGAIFWDKTGKQTRT